MSEHVQGATALQDGTRVVGVGHPRARVDNGRDWALALLIFGSAVAMYVVAGFGIYVALQAFVL